MKHLSSITSSRTHVLAFILAMTVCILASILLSTDTPPVAPPPPTAAAPQETTVTLSLTVPATFERESENTWLRINHPTQSFRFHWSYLSSEGKRIPTLPCELQEHQSCTFTIEGTRHAGSDTLIDAQIMLITSADGKTLYDRTICEIHRCKMENKEVPIIYGLPAWKPEEPTVDQNRQLFPHRLEVSFGGCIPMPGKTKDKVLVCPQCREAFAKWKPSK